MTEVKKLPEVPSATTSPLDAVARSGVIPRGGRVLAAVSGGPDSTALLLVLHELGVDVVAAHFDHALRPGSAADAEHVRGLCDGLGVDLIAERRERPLTRGSIQAAAREARYDFLERARRRAAAAVVATAHTADDQMETVLINILRGTGAGGLRGIAARAGLIVRPLLTTTRAEITSYLAAHPGVGTLEDPSNADRRFLRARVRHLLLPRLSPHSRGSLLSIAAHAQAAVANLERIDPAPSLRALYVAAGGRAPGLSRVQLNEMKRLLERRRTGASLSLPGGLAFHVMPDGTARFVRHETPALATSVILRERACPGCADDDEGAVHLGPGALALGTRSPGLRMRPQGGRGSRKLQDLFVDAKVPRHERDSYPLVFLDGRLAWVPGIAVDDRWATQKSLPGRHVWLERGSRGAM